MAYINPFIKVNAGGIPRLQAESVKLDGNNVVFDFKAHRFLDYPYAGLIIFKLPAYTAPTTAGDVYFTTEGVNKTLVYDYSGTKASSGSDILETGGVFIGWYSDGKLLIISSLA